MLQILGTNGFGASEWISSSGTLDRIRMLAFKNGTAGNRRSPPERVFP